MSQSSTTRVGVVGAGRVGAVLAAAQVDAPGDGSPVRYRIDAVAGESAASLSRIQMLLPGVPVAKPAAVAQACDLLLVTVPDDTLGDVVSMLSDGGAIRPGQVVVHTSGRHGLAVLRPAADRGAQVLAVHPAMTFTGTALDLDRLTGCMFGVTATESTAPLAQQLVADLGGTVTWVPEERRTLYHAGLTHGASHLVTLVSQAMDLLRASGAEDPAATLRPLLTAALDNALTSGGAALTGPIMRGDASTVRDHLADIAVASPETVESYVVMARATADRAVADGRLRPDRAAVLVGVLNDALGRVTA